MVVTAGRESGAGLRLLVAEDGQDAKDDGDARVEADAHEALGDGVGNILKVHRLALDEDADGDDGVKGLAAGGVGGEGGQVRGGGAEEVAGRCAGAGLCGLDLGGLVESVGLRVVSQKKR